MGLFLDHTEPDSQAGEVDYTRLVRADRTCSQGVEEAGTCFLGTPIEFCRLTAPNSTISGNSGPRAVSSLEGRGACHGAAERSARGERPG